MKKQRLSVAMAILAAGLLLAGCSSKVTQTSQYSGFLSDYSKLQETTSPSGHKTLRWIDPSYKESNYRGLYFQPVVYFPAEKPTARVSQDTLNKIKVAKLAITAVSAENEDMKFYEVVPVAAVVASTMAATGHRTQNTALYIEGELIDQDTGKTVMEVVRKAYGKTVNNDSTPVTADDVKAAIDDIVTDITNFPKQG